MKKQSKNLIAATAHEAFEQLQVIKTARGADLDREIKRVEGYRVASGIVEAMADKQLKALELTGFLPDENIFLDSDEAKLVNAKRNLLPERKKTNLLDEFIRPENQMR